MLNDQHRHEIGRLLAIDADSMGSWTRLATKLGVNQVTIRYNMSDPEKWHLVSEAMWLKVAGKLRYKISDSSWALVPTVNSQVMFELLDRAQNEQMFTAISHDAGQGKSAGVMMYRLEKQGVYYLECEESWSHKRFVQKLAETVGLRVENYSISILTDLIISVLTEKAATIRPLLIIDEANKLKPASLRLFIPLFNALQDQVGMVLIGAHDLKKHIQDGVRRDSRGFDELESRLGRAYMPLVGIFKDDVIAICKANGITDPDVQDRIWLQRMMPVKQSIKGAYHWVAQNDLRVLKQAIKHERLRAQRQPEISQQQIAA